MFRDGGVGFVEAISQIAGDAFAFGEEDLDDLDANGVSKGFAKIGKMFLLRSRHQGALFVRDWSAIISSIDEIMSRVILLA